MMKLTIDGAGQRFTVNMQDQECNEWFRYLVNLILFAEQEGVPTEPVAEDDGPTVVEPEPEEPAGEEPAEEESHSWAPKPFYTSPAQRPSKEAGYKGFLFIECPNCHEDKGFYTKLPMSFYRCKSCEHKFNLPTLVPLEVRCECGKTFRYKTNKADPMFDMECLDCKGPVSVEYNKKNQRYETI